MGAHARDVTLTNPQETSAHGVAVVDGASVVVPVAQSRREGPEMNLSVSTRKMLVCHPSTATDNPAVPESLVVRSCMQRRAR